MKPYMEPGQYAFWNKRRVKCVAGPRLTQQTRCSRCIFKGHILCGWLHCGNNYFIFTKYQRKSAENQIITQKQNIMELNDILELRDAAKQLNNFEHKGAILLVLDKNNQLEMTYAGSEDTVRDLVNVLVQQQQGGEE